MPPYWANGRFSLMLMWTPFRVEHKTPLCANAMQIRWNRLEILQLSICGISPPPPPPPFLLLHFFFFFFFFFFFCFDCFPKWKEKERKEEGRWFETKWFENCWGTKRKKEKKRQEKEEEEEEKKKCRVFPTVVQPPTVEYFIPFQLFNLTQLTLEMNSTPPPPARLLRNGTRRQLNWVSA